MTATAEQYGSGARAPYAQPRESEYDMKERVRLSGLFPRVRNEPLSNQLQALLKDFEKNAALTGILERRRRLEEKTQYELRSREAVVALNTNLAPPFRTGNAGFATSATVASKVADAPVPDAADVMTGKAGKAAKAKDKAAAKAGAKAAKAKVKIRKPKGEVPDVSLLGVSLQGGSVSSTDPEIPVLGGNLVLSPVVQAKKRTPSAKTPPTARSARSPSTSRLKAV